MVTFEYNIAVGYVDEMDDENHVSVFDDYGSFGWEMISYIEYSVTDDSGYEKEYKAIFKRIKCPG